MRKVLKRVVEEGMEVFPKQNRTSPKGYGSLVLGPLGIHLRTGKRYGFLERGFHRRGGFAYNQSGQFAPLTLGRKPRPVQTGLSVIISATFVSSVKAYLTNIDMVLNLCLPIVPENDPHRTVPTELSGIFVEIASQSHGLSVEKLR